MYLHVHAGFNFFTPLTLSCFQRVKKKKCVTAADAPTYEGFKTGVQFTPVLRSAWVGWQYTHTRLLSLLVLTLAYRHRLAHGNKPGTHRSMMMLGGKNKTTDRYDILGSTSYEVIR